MLHAKFQSPSIYIDRYFQLCDSVSDSVSQSLTHSVTYPRCRAVHLARGQGNSYTSHTPQHSFSTNKSYPIRPRTQQRISSIKSDSYLTLNLNRSTKVIACHICIPNASFLNGPSFTRVMIDGEHKNSLSSKCLVKETLKPHNLQFLW